MENMYNYDIISPNLKTRHSLRLSLLYTCIRTYQTRMKRKAIYSIAHVYVPAQCGQENFFPVYRENFKNKIES